MTRRTLVLLAVVLVSTLVEARRADITGKWTASFETAIGVQTYTYDFEVKGATLTGKAKSNLGEASIADGKVDGETVTFVEMLKYEGMDIRIVYTGKVVSNDEIKFTRQVADFATEELVAKRAK